ARVGFFVAVLPRGIFAREYYERGSKIRKKITLYLRVRETRVSTKQINLLLIKIN
ncbi:hypothetical protein GIB67_013563, partial [Kingdonia uniflora]